MPILYRDGGACYFKDTSDARFALQHGWSEDDPAGHIPPTLSPAELQSASDLAEMWRLGHNISAAERTLVANYMLSQADANENWRVMPSEPQNRWW